MRRNIKREKVDLPEGRCTAACITETYQILTLDQPTRIHYRTIDIKTNKSLIYANIRVLRANHESAFNLLGPIRNSACSSLSSYWPNR